MHAVFMATICCGALVATPFDTMAFGKTPYDELLLRDDIRLEHIDQALAHGGKTVEDIFSKNYQFSQAPQPQNLLNFLNSQNRVSESATGELSVISYNVALLIAKVLWMWDYTISPLVDERLTILPDAIFGKGYDVVLLQEVWRDQDVELFRQAANKHGYVAHVTNHTAYNDGLLTCIKKTIVTPGSTVKTHSHPYFTQNSFEFFPGPHVKHGYHRLRFAHDALGEIFIYNTHLIPTPGEWARRMRQARELGLTMRLDVDDSGVAILGGDMNAAPYYPANEWVTSSGYVQTHWWENALAYPFLLYYGDLKDSAIMAKEPQDATLDITLMNDIANQLLRGQWNLYWCQHLPGTTITASDCNSLFSMQYEGTEYSARLDYLLIRDPSNRLRVSDSKLAFTEKYELPDGVEMELSDHYALTLVVEG